jgi:tRNA threonylcarbamoyladenosine biosynthesis protein TsaE
MPDFEMTIPSVITSGSEVETYDTGKQFAERLHRGDIVALYGELGSGKTCFVKGICAGLQVNEPVISPTFTIINQYTGYNGDRRNFQIQHIDCYRLTVIDELIDIGIDEILSSNDICLIEWPQLVEPLIPDDYWKIVIETGKREHLRTIHIERNLIGEYDDSRY